MAELISWKVASELLPNFLVTIALEAQSDGCPAAWLMSLGGKAEDSYLTADIGRGGCLEADD